MFEDLVKDKEEKEIYGRSPAMDFLLKEFYEHVEIAAQLQNVVEMEYIRYIPISGNPKDKEE